MLPPAVVAAAAAPDDERGYFKLVSPFRDENDRQKALDDQRRQFGALLNPFRPIGLSADLTRTFLRSEAAAGALPIIVLMPESSMMRALYEPDADRKLREFLSSIPAPVIDARTWVPDDEFADLHHLRHDGAVRFTDRFTAEVLIPRLGKVRP